MASKACLLETSSTNALVISGKRSRRIRLKICWWDLCHTSAKVFSEESTWIGFAPRLCVRANLGMLGEKRIKKQSQSEKNMQCTDLTRFREDKEVSLLMKNDIITELEGLKLRQQREILTADIHE